MPTMILPLILAAGLGPQEGPPAAKAEDVATIDAILGALYDVISGPAGEARDRDRFRSLFVDGARLIPVVPAADGPSRARVLTVEEFLEASAPVMERRGFFEREIARKVERFGAVAHVFSTYESRWAEDDPEPFARGINSVQLFHDGDRWYVVTIYWDAERPDSPIPPEYLPGDDG